MFPTASNAASVLSTDLGVLLGLMVMARLLDPARLRDRVLFGVTAASFLMIYTLWRWHDTLPTFDLTLQALWPRLFITLEIVAISYTLMSILILTRSVDRSAQADAAQRALARGEQPAVDIFICTYDEPMEIVERSILAALALDYANKTVWVLDDTRRDWLRSFCDEVGARHLTRPDNKGAKAGNLNNALTATARVSNAPVILVLDADFAPRRDFLQRTVGLLLSEPDIAVVQTPQFYYNPDPIQHNLLASGHWVDDQRFFFDVFQPAKDAWGCAFCVGTSFVVRRERLTEIGGFPHAAISEDLNLTYTLLKRGFRTVWLNEPLSFGLSAEGVPEYITQRARWCLGTIQVALLRDGPLRSRGYSFTQRWHFLHGVLNWLCKPFMVLLLIAPPIYWFAGLPAFEADYLSFLRYGVPALLGTIIYMGWISRSKTLPLFMEATHAVTCFAVTATLLSAAIRPFGRPFKVTDKGGDRSRPRVHGKLAAIFGLIAASSAAAIVWAFVSPNAASEISSIDYFNLLWAGIAMLIAFIAFLVCFELPRSEDQFPIAEAGWLAHRGEVVPCHVEALSLSSARLAGLRRGATTPGSAMPIHLDGLGWIDASVESVSKKTMQLRLQPSEAQRRQLVVRLFSSSCGVITGQARLRGALAGLARRGFVGR
ncbi:cellulose synthase catalytic subunit [Bradyrhizobium sp. STM 3809]|uniref:glycosyltransferase family 2 protein n=1 Tax=Bradyrhizobium sp. STM 3809 TaxID=551936 RepID=UPI00024097F2|nr:cellulose synthase catalytic subunit [Bradyrhizobium sp. STM 3809]CCE01363.1 putative Glycosyltransferase, possibly the catalytic subunit of a cellulose synthase [Bradyrhizobium sp. STM 3809]